MMMRLPVATTLALLVTLPLAGALAETSDPLKIPGAEPKASMEAKPAGDTKPMSMPMAGKAAVAPVSAAALGTASPMTEAQKYCQNVAAAAADARFAWQSKKLSDLEGQIKQRVEDLEAKETEVKDILARYNDAVKRAKQNIVDIYAKMKPETAALQMADLDEADAAAILSQLNAGKASAILNEITPSKAAKLVTTMSSLVPSTDGKKS